MNVEDLARKLATDDKFSLNPSDPQYFAMMDAYRKKAQEMLEKEQNEGIRAELEAMANFRSAWFFLLKAIEFVDLAENLLYNVEGSVDMCYITEEEYTELRRYIHQIQGSAHVVSLEIAQLVDELELTEGDFLLAFKNAMIIRNDL